MKKVLFISPGAFGSLTDTYYYALLLKDKYEITYIGFNNGETNINLEGIRIIHLKFEKNKLKNRFAYFKVIFRELRNSKYDFVLINYFIFCSIIRLLSSCNFVVDIRTSFIFPQRYKRILYNTVLFLEIRLFKHITVITENLKKYLHVPVKAHVLPLGGPLLPFSEKGFDNFKLLYVGTFHERSLRDTVIAFSKFYNDYRDKINIHYSIIGFGSKTEIDTIISAISEQDMSKCITYKGVVRYPELADDLKINNIGISYIPLTSFFDCQPPTKTFEYLLSGMVVLATSTSENKLVINNSNGVLITDTIEGIYDGLVTIYNNRFKYNSEVIQRDAQKYTWNSIVENNLIPYIESFDK